MKMYHEINSFSSVRTLLTKPHLPVVNSVSRDQHWRAVHLIYSTDLSDSCAALSFHSSLFLTLCLLWQSYDLPRLSYCFSPVPAPCYICYSTRKDINTHPCSIMHTLVFSMGLSSLWHPWDSFFFLSFSYRVMVCSVGSSSCVNTCEQVLCKYARFKKCGNKRNTFFIFLFHRKLNMNTLFGSNTYNICIEQDWMCSK